MTVTNYLDREWGLFVDGEFVESESSDRLSIENPADGSTLGSVPESSSADVDRAVTAAEKAYEETWRYLSAREHGEFLYAVADRLEAESEPLAQLETLENGKPIAEARDDVRGAVEAFRYYAGAADKFHGDTIPEREGIVDQTVYQPYGVVGCIIPWNWPAMHSADFTSAPLAAGNAVVLKPAPETPLSSLFIAEVWRETLPDGVVNVVTGATEAGKRLSQHPDIGKLAFTGNTSTGSKVMKAAAENITGVMLELGGKNAQVVLPDADLERAVDGVFGGIFTNQGQACSAGSRLVIHEDCKGEFLDAFVEKARELRIGPGTEAETDLGPLASQKQYDSVTKYIELGKETASIVYEGTLPDGLPDGYYVPPVIFDGISQENRLAHEEIFGPVLTVHEYSTVEEALEIVNDTQYGLTAGVWTRNGEAGRRIARRIETGLVLVNTYQRDLLGAPFGGYKKSGIGRKLGFEDTMREFTKVKTIRSAIAGSDPGDLDSYYE